MVKVLVVDDDKMARQGLILSIRWESFGMRVVGEAPNGLKALQFLDENPVDLVLTDLAMPVMSGIELMKRAKETHPGVLFAVLSFHEDFEYTREALRLGAIDYVSKLQLEKENLDTVLGRIRDRIGATGPSPQGGDEALAFFPVSSQTRVESLARELAAFDPALDDLAQGALWRPGRDRASWEAFAQRPPALEGWTVVRVHGLLGESRARIDHLLRLYQSHALFYDYRPGMTLEVSLDGLEGPTPGASADLGTLRTGLCSLEWLHHPDSFASMVAQLRSARLDYLPLLRMLVALEAEWNALYGTWTRRRCELPTAFRVWAEVEAWLRDLRDFTYQAPALGGHSPEAQAGVLRAVRILHTEFASPLRTGEVASRVHMSRSHFCTCFKEIIGQSFLDYLSAVRLDQARQMLRRSDAPVYEVARQCGYADERYFGRLFRQATGVLPQDYRRAQSSEVPGTIVR